MLSEGLRLGVFFFVMLSLVGLSFSSFTFVESIDINQSVATYKSFEKLGHFLLHGNDTYVVDAGSRLLFTVANNSVQKFIIGSSTPEVGTLGGLFISGGKLYIANGENVLITALSSIYLTKVRFIATIGKIADLKIYDGKFYLLDSMYSRVFVHSMEGGHINQFGSPGVFDGQLSNPFAIDIYEDMVYVTESGNKRVSVFHKNGTFIRSFGKSQPGKLDFPTGIAVTEDYIFVSDRTMQRVVVFNRTSYSVLDILYDYGDNVSTFFWPMDIQVDSENKFLYVADHGRNHIRKYSYEIPAEKPVTTIVKGDKVAAESKLAEAKELLDSLDSLVSIATDYGISFVSRAKEYYDFGLRLSALSDYEGARQNALQSLLFCADEKMSLVSQIRTKLSDERDELVATYSELIGKRALSGIAVSTSAYELCDSELVSLIANNQVESAYSKKKECVEALAKSDSEYKSALSSKNYVLFSALDEFKAAQKALKDDNDEFGYGLVFSTLDSLVLEFSNKLNTGKVSAAESTIPVIRAEIASLKDSISKETLARAAVVSQIKQMSEMASSTSKDFPDVYEKRLPLFTRLMDDARKNPAKSLTGAQALVEEITSEVSARRSEQTKLVMFAVAFLVALFMVSIGAYAFFRKKG